MEAGGLGKTRNQVSTGCPQYQTSPSEFRLAAGIKFREGILRKGHT
jgi:hypothetical protein